MKISKKQVEKDIELIFELGTLRRVKRGWNTLLNVRFQNVAEHTLRTTWIAYLFAQYYPAASLETVFKYALSYNLYRTRTSDPHYVALPNLKLNKDKALNDIFKSTSLEKEYLRHISKYYAQDSIEADIVYIANAVENILELKELTAEGVAVAKIWLDLNYKNFYSKLKLDIGRKFLDQLETVNPYDWHLAIKDTFDFNVEKKISNQRQKEILFLFEIGTLRYVPRNWAQFADTIFSNVSEHTFRAIWVSLILEKYLDNINIEKLITMLLLHDLDEIRGVELNYVQAQYMTAQKEQAIKGTLSWLEQKEKLIQIYTDYKKGKSPEAALAKDADSLEPIFELKEKASQGVLVASSWLESNKKRLQGKLNHDISNIFFDVLLSADPNSWHLNAKNRFSYDW